MIVRMWERAEVTRGDVTKLARLPLQRGAIPSGEIRRAFVRALEERERRRIRIRRGARRLVRQQELAHVRMVVGLCRLHARTRETVRLGIRVTVERRLADHPGERPAAR